VINNTHQLRVTLEQMAHLISVIEDFRRESLQKVPSVEALAAEGPIDQLETMRREALEFVEQLPEIDLSSLPVSDAVESTQ
jgi:hypothetical protein